MLLHIITWWPPLPIANLFVTLKEKTAHTPMDKSSLVNIDLNNTEFQYAWSLLKDTNRSVFLTGKAGTGKSTFLKYIRENIRKKSIVLAPTGIASVNVGGQTLHSFFKIPFKPLLPDDPELTPKRLLRTLRYSADKMKLIQNLELIIIDEISMVRADIIDFIDKVLRVFSKNMREPFGGKQLLFVGDVYQLEPVVTRDAREILSRSYKQFNFFNAHVFSQLGLVPIELRKVYRQKEDADFLALLDRVRGGHATLFDINTLNLRYNPNYKDTGDSFSITLAMRRDTVDAINDEHMHALTTPEYTFIGIIENEYPVNELPTNKVLVLKQDAQVMFVRNDKEGRWVNGTLAKVCEVSEDLLKVELENGNTYQLEMEMWENIQYSYDEKENKIIEQVLGSFSQFPIKPAWAITVHKSQGLTFNNVVIDFGGGAFSSGQTYVALSRCTSLRGITLLTPIRERDIIINRAVVEFSKNFNNSAIIDSALRAARSATLYRKAAHAFDHYEFSECVKSFTEAMTINNVTNSPAVQRLVAQKLYRFSALKKEVKTLEEVIDAQNQQLRSLAEEFTEMGKQALGYGDLAEEDEVAYGTRNNTLDEIAYKSAIANFNKAIRICPSYTPAYIGKAHLLYKVGEVEEAEKIYQTALKAVPDSYEVHMALGHLCDETNRSIDAIKHFLKAAQANGKAPQPYEALVSVLKRMELTDKAKEFEKKAKKLRKELNLQRESKQIQRGNQRKRRENKK